MTLSERISAATPDQQRELLEGAYVTIYPFGSYLQRGQTRAQSYRMRRRFCTMLDAEAYLDAAMMLVGDFRLLCLVDLGDGQWAAKLWKMPACSAATPALALLAAIAQARDLK